MLKKSYQQFKQKNPLTIKFLIEKVVTVGITTHKLDHKYLKEIFKYIPECYFKYIEFIIVNDGKKNISNKITNFLNKKTDIRIYNNNRTRGISYSRNKLLKKCNTKWITFVDADDNIKLNRKNLKLITNKKNNFDFIIFQHLVINNEKKNISESFNEYGLINNKRRIKLLKKYLIKPRGNSIFTHVWGKFFLVSFLKEKKIKFLESWSVLEDYLFFSICFKKSKFFYISNNILYHHHQKANYIKNKLIRRHANDKSFRYKRPIKNFSSILSKEVLKKYENLGLQYWKNKILYLKKLI